MKNIMIFSFVFLCAHSECMKQDALGKDIVKVFTTQYYPYPHMIP